MMLAFEKAGETEKESEIRDLLGAITDADDPYGAA
jgi:hypothetical protein